ncbi:MAG: hypothetical protein ACRBB4_15710 [Neptuniibacter sp.]
MVKKIPKDIKVKLSNQPHAVRCVSDLVGVVSNIQKLGIKNVEFVDFFTCYDLSGVTSRRDIELIDIYSPSDAMIDATHWAQDMFDLGGQFVCMTSGEGEEFIVFSKIDGSVFEVGIEEIDELNSNQLRPKWKTFYDLIRWYVELN